MGRGGAVNWYKTSIGLPQASAIIGYIVHNGRWFLQQYWREHDTERVGVSIKIF